MSLRPRGLKKWSQVMEETAHNTPALPPGLEGLGPGVLRPNHPNCRRHTLGEPWGVGEGDANADSPGLMVSLRAAWRVCRVPPPAPQACAALGWAPTMTTGRAWIGRLLAGVCRARLGRPIGLPACAALGRPMPPMLQRGFDSLEDTTQPIR